MTEPTTVSETKTRQTNLCWIHIKDVYTFLHLGANPHEQRIGQNIRFDLSVQIPFLETNDALAKTTDYGTLIKRVQEFMKDLEKVDLLEYLSELILNLIGNEFPGVHAAKLTIHKGFVPLPNFTGSVSIQCERQYKSPKP